MFEAIAVVAMLEGERLHVERLTPEQRQRRSDMMAAQYKLLAQLDHDKTLLKDRTRARQMFATAARGSHCPWRRFRK